MGSSRTLHGKIDVRLRPKHSQYKSEQPIPTIPVDSKADVGLVKLFPAVRKLQLDHSIHYESDSCFV
jgi:hypothetical protein